MFRTPNLIRLADGTLGTCSIDATASDHLDGIETRASNPPARARRARQRPPARALTAFCRDELCRGYSPGAVVMIVTKRRADDVPLLTELKSKH